MLLQIYENKRFFFSHIKVDLENKKNHYLFFSVFFKQHMRSWEIYQKKINMIVILIFLVWPINQVGSRRDRPRILILKPDLFNCSRQWPFGFFRMISFEFFYRNLQDYSPATRYSGATKYHPHFVLLIDAVGTAMDV